MSRFHLMPKAVAFIALILAFSTSCDKVDCPLVPLPELDYTLFPGEPVDYPFPTFEQNENELINVLFEDYTGHKCVPCAAAAPIAEGIADEHPNRVFLTQLHASPFGEFQSVDAAHPIDYTTEAGTAYANEITGFEGNPQATANRGIPEGASTIWLASSTWVSNVDDALELPLEIDLQLKYNHYPETNGLFLHVETEFKTEVEGRINVVSYLIRKETVSPQSTPFGLNPQYTHHNVMSGAIGGTWGVNVASNTTAAGSKFYTDFSYELPDPASDETYALENLMVFTYVFDRETYQVYQVVGTEIE